MWENPKLLLNKKPNFKRLSDYGFKETGSTYTYSCDIADNSFRLDISVDKVLSTYLSVTDKETNEQYALIFNKEASGAFVGWIRGECERVLTDIVASCYDTDIFKLEQTKLLLGYARDKYGACAEYLWEKTPNNAILRVPDSPKWFAAILTIEKRKLGIYEDGEIEIVDLKESPYKIEALIDGINYLPGYHMNKKHWYTICLDGRVPTDELYRCVDNSYNMVAGKVKK